MGLKGESQSLASREMARALLEEKWDMERHMGSQRRLPVIPQIWRCSLETETEDMCRKHTRFYSLGTEGPTEDFSRWQVGLDRCREKRPSGK